MQFEIWSLIEDKGRISLHFANNGKNSWQKFLALFFTNMDYNNLDNSLIYEFIHSTNTY